MEQLAQDLFIDLSCILKVGKCEISTFWGFQSVIHTRIRDDSTASSTIIFNTQTVKAIASEVLAIMAFYALYFTRIDKSSSAKPHAFRARIRATLNQVNSRDASGTGAFSPPARYGSKAECRIIALLTNANGARASRSFLIVLHRQSSVHRLVNYL